MKFILRHLNKGDNYMFSKVVGDNSDDEMTVTSLQPPVEGKGKHEVVGFCNGTFLLEYVDGDVVVWNPLLSRFAILPLPPIIESPPCSNSQCDGVCQVEVVSRICGIGFDPKSGDYKVLRFISNYYHHPRFFDHACLIQAQVYSLMNDCWEEIEIDGEECSRFDVVGYATYLGGFCYWMAEMVDGGRVIVSFDLSNHKFSTIPIPFACNSYEYGHILLDFQGSLCLVLYQRKAVYKTLYPRVWVLKDGRYQWTTDLGFKVKVQVERPLGYLGDGKVLLLEDGQGKLLVYDSTSQKLSKVDQLHDHPHCMQLFALSDDDDDDDTPGFPLRVTSARLRLCIENTVKVQTLDTSTVPGTNHLFCQLLP